MFSHHFLFKTNNGGFDNSVVLELEIRPMLRKTEKGNNEADRSPEAEVTASEDVGMWTIELQRDKKRCSEAHGQS